MTPVEPTSLGVALIGAGMIGETHVAALSALADRVRLKAIVTRNLDNVRPLAAQYAGEEPTCTSDLSAIASDPDIAFAIVATPPSVRHSVIGPLAEAGKHILLEKPVARTVAEAQEIVDICDRAGVMLGIVFQHRVRAPSIAARKLVDSGQMGKLGMVEIAVPLWRDQSYYDELGRGTYARDGGGVMLTNAIHSIDLALSLTGPVEQVQAMTATTSLHRMEAEDFATAGLRFACGAVGSFTAGTAMFPHRTETIRLHFANGSMRIDKNALEVHWRGGRHEILGQGDQARGSIPSAAVKYAWHQSVIEDFMRAIRNGTCPLVTGADALASQRLIEAIASSSRSGRAVSLPASLTS